MHFGNEDENDTWHHHHHHHHHHVDRHILIPAIPHPGYDICDLSVPKCSTQTEKGLGIPDLQYVHALHTTKEGNSIRKSVSFHGTAFGPSGLHLVQIQSRGSNTMRLKKVKFCCASTTVETIFFLLFGVTQSDKVDRQSQQKKRKKEWLPHPRPVDKMVAATGTSPLVWYSSIFESTSRSHFEEGEGRIFFLVILVSLDASCSKLLLLLPKTSSLPHFFFVDTVVLLILILLSPFCVPSTVR